MFKKVVEAKSQQRLSGADRKKLKRTIKEKFPRASDADIDLILPPKAELTVTKYQNRAQVYAVEGGFPMFFDVDGRGSEFFPTVYALWKVPELLPSFVLKGGEVSRYVIGGADLMFPGISIPAEGLPSFSAGEPWAVKVPGNPAPIAVGTTTMSSTEASRAIEGHHVPNAGFFEDVVFEDPAVTSLCEASGSCESTDAPGDQQQDDVNNDEGANSMTDIDVNYEVSLAPQVPIEAKNDIVEQVVADMSNLKVTGNATNDDLDVEGQHSLSIEDVDALLDKCLLQALHTTVKDKDLPMPGSSLWSSHVLHCRPAGVTLDIKKSSHKKLSKWLQSKVSAGLISVKEDKHKKEVILVNVNRGHPDYTSFRPEKRQTEKIDHASNPVVSEGSQKLLGVAEVYKPSVHANPIFASVGASMGRFYSASEATDIVFRYIETENLVKPTDKSFVVLDATLCDALYKGAIKKGSTYPTEIHKRDLGPTFISRMQAYHSVTRGSESVVRKGALKAIQIMTERRQGNKKVTKLSGLELFLINPESLASELQKKFACSTSVADLPGKKGEEVLVQGGVIEDLAKHLIEQYGIPRGYIERVIVW
ncbi:SUI1 domain [Dillenia turbinata]|uniref:SUI1 domain n=1 Tax=Dillenia turbinata TaxID=194707 RepID=A0AAN8ZHH1_9MAGN